MRKELRILIVDDSETDAQLLLRALRAGGIDPRYERVDTAEGTQRAVDGRPWDIVLCDYTMPQFNALDALEIIQSKHADLPVIIISGTIGEDVAVAAMRAGARDYLLKDQLARLIPAIEREVLNAQERRTHKLAEATAKLNSEIFTSLNEALILSGSMMG